MLDPIRLLHFSDIHIGMENYGQVDPASGINGRVLDFLHRFDEVVDYAIAHEADLFVLNLECAVSDRGSRWNLPSLSHNVLLRATRRHKMLYRQYHYSFHDMHVLYNLRTVPSKGRNQCSWRK